MSQTWIKIGRVFFMIAIATAAMLAMQTQAQAAVCKVKLDDVGTIIGKGATKNLAFEDAASQCFDKKASKSRRATASLSESAGLDIIDLCANVRCEG